MRCTRATCPRGCPARGERDRPRLRERLLQQLHRRGHAAGSASLRRSSARRSVRREDARRRQMWTWRDRRRSPSGVRSPARSSDARPAVTRERGRGKDGTTWKIQAVMPRRGASGSGAMATPRALFTPATWSEDDSDEENTSANGSPPHSPRGAVQRRARRERARASTARSHLGRAPRTAGAAPRSPDSDVDENTDPWGDFGASPRRGETRGDGNAPARDPPDDDSTFMPRTAEVRSLAGQLAKLGIEVPYQRSPGHEARGDVAWDAAAHEAMLRRPRPRMKPAVDSTRRRRRRRGRGRQEEERHDPRSRSRRRPPSRRSTHPRRRHPGRADAGAGDPARGGVRTAAPSAVPTARRRIRRVARDPSPGALSESAHFGVYAHLWWSGGAARCALRLRGGTTRTASRTRSGSGCAPPSASNSRNVS